MYMMYGLAYGKITIVAQENPRYIHQMQDR